MMRMSPQTVGLIICFIVMNLLTTCMPAEFPYNHDQPSTVLQLLRRFWPFINPTRPIAEPLTPIKYFHTSPRHNSRFLYAKKRLDPEEPRVSPHIYRNAFGIHRVPSLPTIPTGLIPNFKNEFLHPIRTSYLFPPREILNTERRFYPQRRNANHHNTGVFPYSDSVKRRDPHLMSEDTMDFPHSAKYEEIDLPQSKILDKLKRYNPLVKLSRRRETESKKQPQNTPAIHNASKTNPRNYDKHFSKLPLQHNKNHPYFRKHEPPLEKVLNEKTAQHSKHAVPAQPLKLFNKLRPPTVPALNYSSEDALFKNLGETLKNISNTSPEELKSFYSQLRWNSTCISLRNLCLMTFSHDSYGNRCLLLNDTINVIDEFTPMLNHIVKEFGKPCKTTEISSTSSSLKTPSDVLPVARSVLQNVNTSVPGTSLKPTPKPYSSFKSIQRKSRMLKVVKDDLVPSTGESLETSLPYALQNETTYRDTDSVPLPPSSTISLVDRRDVDYVPFVTSKQNSEPNSFNETEAATFQYSLSLLPNNITLAVEGKNGNVVPEVTEKPRLTTFSIAENVQSNTVHDTETYPLNTPEDLLITTSSDEDEFTSLESTEEILHGSTPRMLSLRIDEQTRQGKMTGTRDKTAGRSTNVFGRRFRTADYDSEAVDSATSGNVAVFVPEFKPGSLSNFSITFRRQPMKHMTVSDVGGTTKTMSDEKPRRYYYNVRGKSFGDRTTEIPKVTEGFRVIGSTFFPNRVQKVSLHFGKKNMNSTTSNEETDQRNSLQEDSETDEGESELSAQEVGFTMEKLAYLLIGTCCCLSIICLLAVVAAIKCRRLLIERRLRNKLFRHNLYHSSSVPWQQHAYDRFLYLNGRPAASLSSRDSCNCRCVTWTLGARNLDTRPICPTRNSIYLSGPKNLPFGAASTLCYETMIHSSRKKHAMRPHPPPRLPAKSEESSNENDSLDPSSDADNSPTSEKRCTCIHPYWAMRNESPNAAYKMRQDKKPNRKKSSGCPHNLSHPETGTSMSNSDCPPPVSGSDYLDRTDGVVYWSSNDERLI